VTANVKIPLNKLKLFSSEPEIKYENWRGTICLGVYNFCSWNFLLSVLPGIYLTGNNIPVKNWEEINSHRRQYTQNTLMRYEGRKWINKKNKIKKVPGERAKQ
jgi:hypothetical protein